MTRNAFSTSSCAETPLKKKSEKEVELWKKDRKSCNKIETSKDRWFLKSNRKANNEMIERYKSLVWKKDRKFIKRSKVLKEYRKARNKIVRNIELS